MSQQHQVSVGFTEVLAALMSPNNAVRRQAEQYYEHRLASEMVAVIQDMLTIVSNGANDLTVRSLCAILMRRSVAQMVDSLPVDVITQLKASLLALWSNEGHPMILKRLAHILAEFSTHADWPELLPSVLAAASQGKDDQFLVGVLSFLEIACDYCPDNIQSSLAALCGFLGAHISSADANVQVACARAICACIEVIEDDQSRNAFKPALQPILQILGNTLGRGEESDATCIMDRLVTIAEIQPMFFKGSLDGLVSAMLVVAGSDSLEFSTRSMALELMVTISESAPAMARKCPGLVQGVVPLGMSLMLEMEEEESEWVAGKYSDTEETPDENCQVGEEAVERLAAGLGGRSVAPVLLPIVQQFASSAAWAQRRAAVAGLLRLAEGSTAAFEPYFAEAIGFFSKCIGGDPSWRVRYEAIQAVGRFAALFPAASATLIQSFVPSLIVLLQDTTSAVPDKVRGHAASALISLTAPDTCDEDALQPFLEAVLGALVSALQSASLDVRMPCLVLLGSIAQAATEAFMPFYSAIIPGIKAILAAATGPDLAVFRGKAMECAGLIAEAVGPSVFAADAQEIMQTLMLALAHDTDSDATFDYVLPACARISKSLGPHFKPYLEPIMPPLLAAAVQEVHFAIEDAEEGDVVGEVTQDEDTGHDSTVVDFGSGRKKRITVSTSAAQQKNQAARMIHDFAGNMRHHLGPQYLAACFQALMAMLASQNLSDIRSSSALALSKVFSAMVATVQHQQGGSAADLQAAMNAALAKIAESLMNESNATSRGCLAEALRDILEACYASGSETVDGKRSNPLCLPDASMTQKLTQGLLVKCGESVQRRVKKEKDFQENEGVEEEDKAALNEELEEEDDLIRNLVDSLGQLMKLHRDAYMPIFDASIAPLFSPFMASSAPVPLQIAALCMVDDAIEFGGVAHAQKYFPSAMQTFLGNLLADDLVLRQCSVYGVAQIARVAPSVMSASLGTVLPALARILSDPSADSDDNIGVTENAAFAVGALVCLPEYRSVPGLDLKSMVGPYLAKLPLKSDETQAKVASHQLCELVATGDSVVLGDGMGNLPSVLRVFADCLLSWREYEGKREVDPEVYPLAFPATVERIKTVVQTIARTVDAAVLAPAFAALNGEQQGVLQAC